MSFGPQTLAKEETMEKRTGWKIVLSSILRTINAGKDPQGQRFQSSCVTRFDESFVWCSSRRRILELECCISKPWSGRKSINHVWSKWLNFNRICFVGHKNSGAPPYKGSRKPLAVLDDRFDRLPWMELVRGNALKRLIMQTASSFKMVPHDWFTIDFHFFKL